MHYGFEKYIKKTGASCVAAEKGGCVGFCEVT